MKETFYFSHDYNARNDAKIIRLLIKHGFEGYGIYWAIIEDLYQNANALQSDYESIAYALRTDAEKIKSIINDFDLFVFEGDFFGSLSVQRRIEERNRKSKKASHSANIRWAKYANAMQTHSERNANASKSDAKKERKGKDSIEEDIKEDAHRSFLHLSISKTEFNTLCQTWKPETVESILDAIENYKNNKNYKSLYLTANKWLKKDYPNGDKENPFVFPR